MEISPEKRRTDDIVCIVQHTQIIVLLNIQQTTVLYPCLTAAALVRKTREEKYVVVSVPGASAASAVLSQFQSDSQIVGW